MTRILSLHLYNQTHPPTSTTTTDLTDLEGLLRGGDNDEDMQMDEEGPEMATTFAPTNQPQSSVPVEQSLADPKEENDEIDEDGDIEMDVATEEPAILSGPSVVQEKDDHHEMNGFLQQQEKDQETPFPPIPSELQQQEFMQYVESRQVVPTWESEALRRQQEEEQDHEGDLYYFTQQLDESLDAFLNLTMNDNQPPLPGNLNGNHHRDSISDNAMNLPDLLHPPHSLNTHRYSTISSLLHPSSTRSSKKPSMDDLLRRAIESHIMHHSHHDSKHTAPLIPHKSLLTLLAFRSGQHLGVAVPDANGGGSSGYETKSILSDLLLLRTPALPFLYGGDTDLEPDGRLASEVYQMPRTRKKEKARDSGQGKAPVKTAEQKAARKKMMEEAAARKKQSLAEAAVRREVKYLAKLERAESKGIKLDPASLARKEELKKRVGGIVITRKETKRDKAKKERLAAEEAARAASGAMQLNMDAAGDVVAGSSSAMPGGLASGLSAPTTSAAVTTAGGAGLSSAATSPAASTGRKGVDFYSDDDEEEDDDGDLMDQDLVASGAGPSGIVQTQHHQPPPLPLPKSPPPKKKTSVKQAVKSSPPIKLKLSAPAATGSPRKVVLKLSTVAKPVPATQQPLSANGSSMKSPEEKILCICHAPTIDYGLFMVCCDTCNTWFHGTCVGWTDFTPGDFYCQRCS